MITTSYSNNPYFVGLSTDEKPTNEYILNGSLFLEMDTAKVFIFDKENMQWIEFGTTPEPKPEPADTLYNHYINWHGYFMTDSGQGDYSYTPTTDVSGVFTLKSTNETTLESLNDFYIAWINSSEPTTISTTYSTSDGTITTTNLISAMIPEQPETNQLSILIEGLVPFQALDDSGANWLIVESFEDYSSVEDLPQAIDELVWDDNHQF